MILNKNMDVKIQSSNVNYFASRGYECVVGDTITISIDDLPKNSNKRILVKCDNCETTKDVIYNSYNRCIEKSPDKKYRCRKCSIGVKKNTCLERYGNENYTNRDKYKKTLQDRYGGHYNQLDKFKEKTKQTNLIKYGSDHPMRSTDIKNKRLETLIEKYNTTNLFSVPEILDKYKDSMLEKYGVEFSMQSNPIKEKILIASTETKIKNIIKNDVNIISIDYESNTYTVACNLCGEKFNINPHTYQLRKKYKTITCTLCNPEKTHTSGKESQLLRYIREIYPHEIIENYRNVCNPYEIDIYLPELKLGFEFNGVYWHSEIYKSKKYHQKKTELCESNGIRLIHIWEDDWTYKNDIVKSMIAHRIGMTQNRIFARKCYVKEIDDTKIVRKFLDENHIQGFVGSKIRLGLFFKNDLISIMTFGNLRKSLGSVSKDNYWELLRFCNKKDTSVVGGSSKLWKHFLKNVSPDVVVSYADRDWSNGDMYKKIGFVESSKTEPNYFWVVDGIKKHRYNFRKDVLVSKGFDKKLSEYDIMVGLGYYRVYNTGNIKFTYSTVEIKKPLFNNNI